MNNKTELLKEELKRFNTILEYAFYEDRSNDDNEDLLLGSIDEDGEDNEENAEGDTEELDLDGIGDEISNDLGISEPNNDEIPQDDIPQDSTPIEAPIEEPTDEVELDITELVQGTEEAKQSADMANDRLSKLMNMVSKLEGQIAGMSRISNKIDSLETEMEKRMPTDNEKLEMRSLDSAPFNMRLGDYWSNKEGKYDTMNSEPEEYTLTRDDVNASYSDSMLKDSLDREYEEEDV